MTIFGTITAIILAIVVTMFLGPYGGVILISLIFGLVFSIHARNKQIYEDVQRIKEKLGITDYDDFNMSNEEIEEELNREEELNKDDSTNNDSNKLTERNKQI
jgi:hypothetical protein